MKVLIECSPSGQIIRPISADMIDRQLNEGNTLKPVKHFFDEKNAVAKHATVREGGTIFELQTHGISFTDRDRRGNLWLPTVAMYFTMLRFFALTVPDYCISQSRMPNHTLFLVQISYKISEKFYQVAKSRSIWFPMTFTSRLTSISKSSVITTSTLSETSSLSDESLVRAIYKQTNVDFATRRSSKFNKDWIEKYSQFVDAPSEIASLNIPGEIHEDAERITIMVRYSDTDYNAHLNNTKFLMFCLDAANTASMNGKLRGFEGDISGRFVESVDCTYLKECHIGDVITCAVWQDEYSQDTLHVVIMNSHVKLFYCVIRFFPEAKLAKL